MLSQRCLDCGQVTHAVFISVFSPREYLIDPPEALAGCAAPPGEAAHPAMF
jgi:hypothetical protein